MLQWLFYFNVTMDANAGKSDAIPKLSQFGTACSLILVIINENPMKALQLYLDVNNFPIISSWVAPLEGEGSQKGQMIWSAWHQALIWFEIVSTGGKYLPFCDQLTPTWCPPQWSPPDSVMIWTSESTSWRIPLLTMMCVAYNWFIYNNELRNPNIILVLNKL